jgi:predicted ferric reductase
MINKKTILLTLLFLSLVPTFAFANYARLDQGNNLLALLARLHGVGGATLLLWQIILGTRGITSRIMTDLIWVNNLHKISGKIAGTAIIIHFVLVFILYMQRNFNVLLVSPDSPIYLPWIAGLVAFIGVLVIWITSALARSWIPFRHWKRIHILAYLIVPIGFAHALGMNLNVGSSVPYLYWTFLMLIYCIFAGYQLLFYTGWLRSKYRVTKNDRISPTTHSITLSHKSGRKLEPKPGQFVYVQHPVVLETHPFSVSGYDAETGDITLTIKNLGPFSSLIQDLSDDEHLLVDGPYGVFTQEIYETQMSIVMLAGGIGITPFMRTIRHLPSNISQATLLYGNKSQDDVAFLDELDEHSDDKRLKIVHVLGEGTLKGRIVENGYITKELLTKHLDSGLDSYLYFVCGPPAMMDAMYQTLLESGVSKKHICFEKFSL